MVRKNSRVCLPFAASRWEWLHMFFSGLILAFVFVPSVWAPWIIVLAAAGIFVSSFFSYCQRCKK